MVKFVDDEFGEIVYFIEASTAVAVVYNKFEVLESSSDLHCKTYITKVKRTSKGTRLARDIARKCVIVDLPDSTYICHIPNFVERLIICELNYELYYTI